jgi:MtrB/PioB family decaheme-associated outer membrane protein
MTSHMHTFTSRTAAAARGIIVAAALIIPADRAAAQTTGDQATAAAPAKVATGTVEIGIGDVSPGSFKAGEYNGLEKKGLFAIGALDVRGGAPYDSDRRFRWRVRGTDLGLATRNLMAEAGKQGTFRVLLGYDSLLRNSSDSYQTPYVGAGTNTLTLPSTWLVPVVASSTATNNRSTAPSARGLVPSLGAAPYIDTQTGSPTIGSLLIPNAAQLALINGAAAADLPLFHNVNLSTKRTRYDAAVTDNLTSRWTFNASVREEHKGGMKAMGTVSRNTGADIATVIPDLIDTDTAQVNSSLSYNADRAALQGGYYGSFFSNQVKSMNWQNWASGPGTTATMNQMSSTPNNIFNQVNLEGRYSLSKTTRVVGNASYARNTQNDPFLTDPTVPVVPVSSLKGLVVSSAFRATLTSRWRQVSLVGRYRFTERDNKTGVHIFQFADADDTPVLNPNFPASAANSLGAVLAQNANANRPYSNRNNLAGLDADYQFSKGQWIEGGYDFERIDRWCNASWISCVDAAVTNENRLRGEWRANIGESLNARAEYTFAARRAPLYNDNAFLALVPYGGVSPAGATGGATALSFMLANGFSPWGPPLGFSPTTGNMNLFFPLNNALANATYANNNRISEIIGLRRYYVSDRNRNKVRSALDWQATQAVSFEVGVDYTGDDYLGARYGLQSSKGLGIDLDGSYTAGGGVTADVFYNFQRQRGITNGNTYTANSNTANVNGFTALSGNTCDSFTTLQQRNNNNKIDPCLDWSANMRDRTHTLGATLARRTDKLTLSGDVIAAWERSTNDVSGGSWANNPLALPGAPAGTIAAFFIPATPLPIVTTNSLELRLNGTYAVAAHQSLRLIYAYLRMRSADWSYAGMDTGPGTVAGLLPSNELPFNYGVHVVGVSYVITF